MPKVWLLVVRAALGPLVEVAEGAGARTARIAAGAAAASGICRGRRPGFKFVLAFLALDRRFLLVSRRCARSLSRQLVPVSSSCR